MTSGPHSIPPTQKVLLTHSLWDFYHQEVSLEPKANKEPLTLTHLLQNAPKRLRSPKAFSKLNSNAFLSSLDLSHVDKT